MRGTILITRKENYTTMKISPGLIFKMVWSATFVVALLFVLSTYLLHISFESRMKNEISSLDNKLSRVNDQILQAQDEYNKLFTKSFERKNSYDIISAVNPNIRKKDIEEWVSIIFFNSDILERYLNSYSIEKLQGKKDLNSLSIGAALILSIGAVESDFYLKRKSHKGAAGGMQLASSLAKELGVRNRFDPKENIKGGIKHIINLLQKFEDHPDQLELTLASYNAGYYRVTTEWMPQWGSVWDKIRKNLIKDKGSFRETRQYVKTIANLTKLFTNGSWADQEDEFWYKYKREVPKIVD